MKKLTKQETDSLVFRGRGRISFVTEIRRLFESLKVGESIKFTSAEWDENYKSQPNGTLAVWAKHMGWKISTRTFEKTPLLYTWVTTRVK